MSSEFFVSEKLIHPVYFHCSNQFGLTLKNFLKSFLKRILLLTSIMVVIAPIATAGQLDESPSQYAWVVDTEKPEKLTNDNKGLCRVRVESGFQIGELSISDRTCHCLQEADDEILVQSYWSDFESLTGFSTESFQWVDWDYQPLSSLFTSESQYDGTKTHFGTIPCKVDVDDIDSSLGVLNEEQCLYNDESLNIIRVNHFQVLQTRNEAKTIRSIDPEESPTTQITPTTDGKSRDSLPVLIGVISFLGVVAVVGIIVTIFITVKAEQRVATPKAKS